MKPGQQNNYSDRDKNQFTCICLDNNKDKDKNKYINVDTDKTLGKNLDELNELRFNFFQSISRQDSIRYIGTSIW